MTAAALSRLDPSKIRRLERGLRRRADRSLGRLVKASLALAEGKGEEIGFENPYKRTAARCLFRAAMAEVSRRGVS